MTDHKITRRDFLKTTGAAAVAAHFPLLSRADTRPRSKVILIRSMKVVTSDGKIASDVLEQMFDDAMMEFFGAPNPADAWERIIKPTDIVGIKTNVWNYLRTPIDLERVMKDRMMAAGVPGEHIDVDDRGVLRNPLFAKATALINVRPMRAHNWAGVGGCLKNYIMFTPNPPDYHPDSCIDLGRLWNLPIVKGKTRLNVLVMLTPQFNCLGPHHFDREFIWPYGGLLVGTDPVALDAVGLRIIEAKRRAYFKEDSPIRPPVTHIRAAEEKHGVGVADPGRIEIITMGSKEDLLL